MPPGRKSFAIMNKLIRTNEKTQLKVSVLKAMLITKVNYKNSLTIVCLVGACCRMKDE